MLIAIDTETLGLGTNFVMGSIVSNEWKKPKTFTKKEDMWNYIMELALKEEKRGHKLNIVAHNTEYDFYAIADLTDKRIKFTSSVNGSGGKTPFLVNIINKDKKIIGTFLDTYSIFKMSLAKASRLIGKQKGITPQWLIEGKQPTKKEYDEAIKYMHLDTRLCLDLYDHIKERLKQEKVPVRTIYTIHQIGISYIMNKLRKNSLPELFFEEEIKKQRTLIKPKYEGTLLEAYRGARVEAFQTGEFEKAYSIDVNSLYPYSICNIDIPDLRTEKLIYNPLNYFSQDKLLDQIGISTVMIKNISCDIGLLPVRINSGNSYYPKKNKLVIGTYTNIELKKATENGYKIIHISKSILWNKMSHNPFKPIYKQLYIQRKKSKTDFDNWFYKSIMNSSMGKMGQRSYEIETIIDSVEKTKEYLKRNYEIIKGLDLEYMFQKKSKRRTFKRFYCPIIPTLLNAYSRCYMFDFLKQIPQKELLYSDTDNIIFTNHDNLNNFKHLLNEEMGAFKLEATGECKIYGRKNYYIGHKMSAGGIHKGNLTIKDFKKGIVNNRKQITIKTANDFKDIGKFTTELRDLNQQMLQHNNSIELLYNHKLYIDYKLYSIKEFTPYIEKWLK
jgi:hypothetical protein